jgi:hypothetical protein
MASVVDRPVRIRNVRPVRAARSAAVDRDPLRTSEIGRLVVRIVRQIFGIDIAFVWTRPQPNLDAQSFRLGATKQSLDPSTASTEPRCMMATCRNLEQVPPDVDA